jgi:hypothetical protein
VFCSGFNADVLVLVVAIVAFRPQPVLRTFPASGIAWWDRARAATYAATPQSPEDLAVAEPSDLVAAVAQLVHPDVLSRAVTGLYETLVAPVIEPEPTSGSGNAGSEASPPMDPSFTPPVASPTPVPSPPADA